MSPNFPIVIVTATLINLSTQRFPCTLEDGGVDITRGKININGVITLNEINFTPESYYRLNRSLIVGCVCNVKSCVRKCCPLGKFMSNRTCLTTATDFVLPKVRSESEEFYFISGSDCPPNKERLLLDPSENDTADDFVIQRDGRLFLPSTRLYYRHDEYCVDYIEDEDKLRGLLCSDMDMFKPTYSAGMIISMPFLLITFIVYAILPDRNLHGKALMCYVIALLGAYLLLVYIQLNPDTLGLVACQTVGIVCFFFFMVSFFWMNVMSIDIWWAFSGLRGFSGSKAEAERKRFLLYCGYAWGVPLLMVILVITLTLSTDLPQYAWYNPGMGTGQCWLREGVPTLVYFYGPMALLIIWNVTLFAITAWKIKRVQQDTAMLRKDESKKHSYESDKQRFNLYLKLMLAMGVNWSMEIISWAIDWQIGVVSPAVWYVTDFCNALYGVFIFFIFVFKRNIWKLLKRRYYMILGKPHLARTVTQNTYSPRTTTISQTSNTEKTFVNDSSILTSEVA